MKRLTFLFAVLLCVCALSAKTVYCKVETNHEWASNYSFIILFGDEIKGGNYWYFTDTDGEKTKTNNFYPCKVMAENGWKLFQTGTYFIPNGMTETRIWYIFEKEIADDEDPKAGLPIKQKK